MAKILNLVSTCLGVLESDISSMSDAHACFLFTLSVIKQADLTEEHRKVLYEKFLYRLECVFSPVHALAFACDPFYTEKRQNIQLKHAIDLIDLGKGQFVSQCHRGLRLRAKDDKGFQDHMLDFMKFRFSNALC